jgi:hypothetical protein
MRSIICWAFFSCSNLAMLSVGAKVDIGETVFVSKIFICIEEIYMNENLEEVLESMNALKGEIQQRFGISLDVENALKDLYIRMRIAGCGVDEQEFIETTAPIILNEKIPEEARKTAYQMILYISGCFLIKTPISMCRMWGEKMIAESVNELIRMRREYE